MSDEFKVGDRVGAIVCNGQFDTNCIILEVKSRLLRKPKYLVKYVVNIRGRKAEVVRFLGTDYPISGSPSYANNATEWVDKVWAIEVSKPKSKKS